MGHEKEIKPSELVETSVDMSSEKKPPARLKWGPGFINLAIPDKGHMPSCSSLEFPNAAAFNAWADANQDKLVVDIGYMSDRIVVLYGDLDDSFTKQEKEVAAYAADKALSEFRKQRDEGEAAEKQAEADAKAAAEELTRVGLLCREKHGAFVKDLPGIGKVKVTRKSIADDILKVFQAAAPDAGWEEKLNQLLKKYVKGEG